MVCDKDDLNPEGLSMVLRESKATRKTKSTCKGDMGIISLHIMWVYIGIYTYIKVCCIGI